MGLNTSALGQFNDELAGKIVLDSVAVGTTAEYVTMQQGVKYQAPINLASVEPVFQGGDILAGTSGSAVFSQRNLTTTKRTAFDAWSLQTITDKYLGKMALPEGSYEETFAIMEDLTSDLVKKARQANDVFIWQSVSGSSTSLSDVAVAAADGLKVIISGSTAGVQTPTGPATGSITSALAYDQLVDMIDALDANVVAADDLTFFCGTGTFTKIVSGLTKQNLFHFDPTSVERRNGMYEVPMPGFPNVRIVGTYGLNGSDRVVLGPSSDIFIGCDLISDVENFKTWFSIDDDNIKYRLRTKLAANVAHPEYWVSNDLA